MVARWLARCLAVISGCISGVGAPAVTAAVALAGILLLRYLGHSDLDRLLLSILTAIKLFPSLIVALGTK